MIDSVMAESKSAGSKSEYSIYVKGLIHRFRGEIHESLELFKTCHLLDPNNVTYMKQIARCL